MGPIKNPIGTNQNSFQIGPPANPLIRIGDRASDTYSTPGTTTSNSTAPRTLYRQFTFDITEPGSVCECAVNWDWRHGTANANIEFEILVDDVRLKLFVLRSVVANIVDDPKMWMFDYTFASAGPHNIKLRYRPVTKNQSLTIFSSFMRIMRVK